MVLRLLFVGLLDCVFGLWFAFGGDLVFSLWAGVIAGYFCCCLCLAGLGLWV